MATRVLYRKEEACGWWAGRRVLGGNHGLYFVKMSKGYPSGNGLGGKGCVSSLGRGGLEIENLEASAQLVDNA